MCKLLRSLFLLLIISTSAKAQVLPKEGSVLNYRIIGFSFPATKATAKGERYRMEIASGNWNNLDSFKKHLIKSLAVNNNRVIAEVPDFGQQYTWRIVYAASLPTKEVRLYHFRTAGSPFADTAFARLRITEKAIKYKDAFVFLDNNRAMYDMDGHLVWFLPKIDSQDNNNVRIRDMKLSPQGSITCVTSGDNIYELDYNGHILWKGPGNYKARVRQGRYHHEFTRLANGHYMAISNELLPWSIDSVSGKFRIDSISEIGRIRARQRRMDFGVITEYNKDGDSIWSWSSSLYYEKLMAEQGLPSFGSRPPKDPLHTNSFFFDEKKKELYVSFRDISQVVKLKYPGGEVLKVYGASGSSDVREQQHALFCIQHACKVSQDGDLYLFDNNSCEAQGHPKVVMIHEPVKKEKQGTVWTYDCPGNITDTSTDTVNIAVKAFKTAGGNVMELQDHSLFVSSCTPYSDVFIVNRQKEILWSAVAELWDEKSKKWIPDPQYRASIIPNRKALEQLIWNSLPQPALKRE